MFLDSIIDIVWLAKRERENRTRSILFDSLLHDWIACIQVLIDRA